MKINAVIIPKDKFNFRKIISFESYKGYLLTAYLSVAVVGGIIIFSLSKNHIVPELSKEFVKFLEYASLKNEFEVFLSILKNTLPYILIAFFLSLSAVGDILIYTLAFVKFAGFGAFTSFLYAQYGISGIKYLFYIFLPGKIIFIIAALVLIDNCVKISRQNREKNRLPSHENRSLVIGLGIALILILLSVLIDLFTLKSLLASTKITSFF